MGSRPGTAPHCRGHAAWAGSRTARVARQARSLTQRCTSQIAEAFQHHPNSRRCPGLLQECCAKQGWATACLDTAACEPPRSSCGTLGLLVRKGHVRAVRGVRVGGTKMTVFWGTKMTPLPPGATRSLLFVTESLRSRSASCRHCTPLRPSRLRPAWETAAGLAGPPPQAPRGDEPADHLRGWQRHAASACDERAFETHLSHLSPASRALLLSQAGPHSSRALNVLPTHEEVVIPTAQFWVLLLRRLRLPLPLAPRRCHCRGQLDPWGEHCVACATAGVLPARPSRLRGRWPVFAARRGPALPKTSVWPT